MRAGGEGVVSRHSIAWLWLATLALVTLCAGPAQATDITVVGLFPNKAVVQINGAAPRTLSINQKTAEGVTLIAVGRDSATFQLSGGTRTLKLGQAHSSGVSAQRSSVTLAPDLRGHFVASGQINGVAVQFVVDTGATLVSMSSADARRIGLSYRGASPASVRTANGVARAYRVKLDTVRIGDITVNSVDALVLENQTMPVLLGMSFLNRMEMKRDGDTMVLTKRY